MGSFKDVYIEFLRVPVVGTIRVGQFKEPFSLDQLTSSNHIMFMERSLADALVPGRSTGIMLTSSQFAQRMTWAVGAFRDTDLFGDDVGDGVRTAVCPGRGDVWRVAPRFSQIDVADAAAGIAGGKLRDITAGVNWYLNPNARIMVNYVNSKVTGIGSANIAQARLQGDFWILFNLNTAALAIDRNEKGIICKK